MTELNIPLLSKLLLLESRTLEFADNKRAQFKYALIRLTYTHYSIRLIRLMLRLSPWSSAVIILGRFYEGFMPSIKLRIKGEFLDIVQAALEKKPFNRTRLYKLGILQVALYFISSTLTDYILDANAYIGHAMSHKLQIDLLRAHLRLSIADLQDSQIQGRHQQAKAFTNSSINTLLGPLHLFQDLTSILAQAWTLRSVLKEKGRRARPLIALSCFNSIFRILYDRWETYERDDEDYAARTSKQDFFYLATDTRARAEISTFGLKDWVLGRYDRLSQHLQQRSSATVNRVRVKGTMRGFVRNLTDAMSYILVATKYTDLTLSSLSLMQSASMDILWNLEALYESCKSLIRDLDSMKNYFDFLDPDMNPSSTPRKEPFADYSEPTGRGMKIVAKDLTFAYPGSGKIKPVLKGLSFTIDKGELIAIVGGNGSGKSTLMTLLTRLYDPKSGSIEVNDIDLRCYDKDELWSHMSTVSQNFGKYYNLSVGHNIGIGDTSSMDDKEAISKAAETGGALDFISSFPDAFETIMAHHHYQRIGHRKKKVQMGISGGQWQRLALSRAFMRLKSADLLLLDEPSASLDPEAEFKLFKSLKEARRGRTTIYISHRFNTVRAANRIMVIEKGELVEFGTHEELMALKGRYSYLYSLQTDALADTPDSDTNGKKKEEESNGEGDKISDGSASTSDDEVQDLIVVNGEKDEIKANGVVKHGDIITNGHVANGHGNGLDSMDGI